MCLTNPSWCEKMGQPKGLYVDWLASRINEMTICFSTWVIHPGWYDDIDCVSTLMWVRNLQDDDALLLCLCLDVDDCCMRCVVDVGAVASL